MDICWTNNKLGIGFYCEKKYTALPRNFHAKIEKVKEEEIFTDGIDKLLSNSSISVSENRDQTGGHVSRENDIFQCE